MDARAKSLMALPVVLATLGGCFGASNQVVGGDGELDPSQFIAGEIWDGAIGNKGYRIRGGAAGTATPVDADAPRASSALLHVVDKGGAGSGDLAQLVVQIYDGENEVSAVLQIMADWTGGIAGGVAHNVALPALSSEWGNFPATTVFLAASGYAHLAVNGLTAKTANDTDENQHPVIAFVSLGIRDDDQAPMAAADPSDLELHLIFPGARLGASWAIEDVEEGHLYYYFETVHLSKLTEDEVADAGRYLLATDVPNDAPRPVAQVLMDGAPASEATLAGDAANVTVTLDGSLSSDADGTVSSWAWQIFEIDPASGNYTEAGRLAGETVQYNFTTPGPKLVRLVVRDDRFGTASLDTMFYVNRFFTRPSTRTLNDDTAGGGAECSDFNCQTFTVGVAHGATQLKVRVRDNGSTAFNGVHVDLYKPGDDPGQSSPAHAGDALNAPVEVTVNQADVLKGIYTAQVWYTAGTRVSYLVDFTVRYSPIVG